MGSAESEFSRALELLTARIPMIVTSVGDPGPPRSQLEGPHPGGALAHDAGLVRTLVQSHADHRGMPAGRFAASLFFQRIAHRVCGAAIGTLHLYGRAVDVTPENLSLELSEGTPTVLHLHRCRPALGADPAAVMLADCVDRLMLPLAEILHTEHGIGLSNLWGNLAASFAKTLCRLSVDEDPAPLQRLGETVFAQRPGLARAGDFRVLEEGAQRRLFYDRRSCCHWYAAPDGRHCTWCSLLTHDERTQRFQEQMSA